MTDERIDIEITDKISSGIAQKLKGIADAAREAESVITTLKTQLSSLGVTSFNQVKTAQTQAATAARTLAAEQKKAAREAAGLEREARKLTNAVNPLQSAVDKLNASITTNDMLLKKNVITTDAWAQNNLTLTRRLSEAERQQKSFNGAMQQSSVINRQARAQLLNLGYQINDIGVSLASGQKPLTVFLQQGSQIAGIYGGAGLLAGFKQLNAQLKVLFPPALLVTIAGALSLTKLLQSEINKTATTKVSFGDTFFAAFQVAGQKISKFFSDMSIQGVSVIGIMGGLFKDFVNNTVGIFKFIYNSVEIVFDSVGQYIAYTMATAYQGIVTFIEDTVNALRTLPTTLGRYYNDFIGFEKFDATAPAKWASGLKLSETTMKNLSNTSVNFTERMTALGEASFNTDFVKNVAGGLSEQAQKNARERAEKEKGGGKGRRFTFDDIRRRMTNDIAELQQEGSARTYLAAVLDAEEKLRRKLTEAEEAEVRALAKGIEVAKAKASILDALREPQHKYTIALSAANELLASGKINTDEYNRSLYDLKIAALDASNTLDDGFRAGLVSVQKEMNNISGLAKNGMVQAFKGMEDALVNFVTKGKLDFRSLADSILADLARIQIRQGITGPLSNFLGSMFSGGNSGTQVYASAASVGPFPTASAKGNIFMGGNVIPFASGGVINSPRIFPMANGGVGLAGEAGPEGILPLRRDSKGNLGVIAANSNKGGGNVVVNVINNTNTKATTTERTDSNGGKTIEVMIDEVVAKKVGQSGSKTNRAIQQNFGISQTLLGRN